MDESTRRIGADWHVCEVQLVLREVALLKNNEGHKRYVDFRNYRSDASPLASDSSGQYTLDPSLVAFELTVSPETSDTTVTRWHGQWPVLVTVLLAAVTIRAPT
eukprot:3221285-Rhodomonas_salina.2